MTPEGRQQKISRLLDQMRDLIEVGCPVDQWRTRMAISVDRLALLLVEAHPQETEKKEDTTRMDRLSTSSDASRTAAPDVAEGDRLTTPNQGRNEARFRAALQRMVDWGDCRCEHDTEDCCAKVADQDFHCPSCIAWHALNDTGDGNQQPSGLRGDPGAPRTVNGEARDKDSSSTSPVTPTEDQT